MSRRIALLGALLLATLGAPVARGQGFIGGYAVEETSGRSLRCLPVALIDSTGAVVDSSWTLREGVFSFIAPSPGMYRVRFWEPRVVDAFSDAQYLGPDANVQRKFPLPVRYDSSALEQSALKPKLRKRGNTYPRYPDELRRRYVEGDVVLAFVVDTNGIPDLSSVIPLASTHKGFLQAVLKALPGYRFEPWTPRRESDCELVVNPFQFRMAKPGELPPPSAIGRRP